MKKIIIFTFLFSLTSCAVFNNQQNDAVIDEETRTETVEVTDIVESIEEQLPPYDFTKLEALAQKTNCNPLWKVKRIDPSVSKWYVDVSELTGHEGDAAFICETKHQAYAYKIIVSVNKESEIWKNCPMVIDAGFTAPHPTTFRVINPEGTPLYESGMKGWQSKDRSPAPDNAKIVEPVIDTSGDDLGLMFYCYQSKWYAFFVH
ncbi:MAG: hypothetical protein OEY19_10260 [Gammaproteobacteria bacterium]|nr:hypothetical protein [Gammaproteobacteria bacterium]MDH5631148.1 hypothetical protein [Gammaproteobacteria bacterium]